MIEHGLFVGNATSILVAQARGGVRCAGEGSATLTGEAPWWGDKVAEKPLERIAVDNRQPAMPVSTSSPSASTLSNAPTQIGLFENFEAGAGELDGVGGETSSAVASREVPGPQGE